MTAVFRRVFASAMIAVIGSLTALGAPAARAGTQSSVDLSGAWLARSGDNPLWGDAQVDTTLGWPSMTLPGAPEAAGFTWYRKHFVLPADWQSDASLSKYGRLYLHLGALRGAARIFINGYEVNELGTMPKSGGGGYQAIAPSADVTVILPVSAPVSGGTVQNLFHWGADNVIALRVYDSVAEPNPAFGRLSIDLPTPSQLYPVTCTTAEADHLFGPNNPVTFTTTFTNTTQTAAPLAWSTDILDETGAPLPGYTPNQSTGEIAAGGSVSYASNLAFGDRPGIFLFRIESKIADATLPPTDFVAGWNVSKIESGQTEPTGFDEFWAGVVREADSAGTHAKAALDPSASADGVAVYRVNFDGLGGTPALAWLSIPPHLPANPTVVLQIPANQGDATGPDIALAKQGFVVMNVITMETEFGVGFADQGYVTDGIADPNSYVFRGVMGKILRAADWLRSGKVPTLPARRRLAIWGESQGGGLALMAAGLLKQDVSAVVAISPYFTDSAHTMETSPTDNPFVSYVSAHPGERAAVDRTLAFYDTVFFGPKIAAPVFYAIGLRDPIEPPSSEFAALNAIAAPCTPDVDPDGGDIPPDAEAKAVAWLDSTLK